MKVIIAGSRSIRLPQEDLERIVKRSGFHITELVCGLARGIDSCGYLYASKRNIPIKTFKPNWKLHGKDAGFMRNSDMAAYADALIYVWDGVSRGTEHMIKEAQAHGLKVHGSVAKAKNVLGRGLQHA